jgi:Ca2+-transporting ATPase
MCTAQATASGVGPLDRQAVLAAARAMAGRGLRVLAMAERQHPERPHDPDDVPEPSELVFLGLMGMMDPPRAGVREAIAGCQRAGIRVVMITGDHAATARAIGAQLGIVRDDAAVLTGAELARLDEEGLRQAVREVSIYARVAPDQKLTVVRALQSWGEVVAVTGDGVNDAPALRASDIGVAMGKAGTDVAREAADMVLADDNFVSIHAAVEQGRVTFDNLRKATFFLVSTGAATVATLLVSMLLGWPVPFVPAQLLWLNLVTKGLQDVAMAFEPGDPDVPHRPPRPRREGLLSRLSWERTVVTTLVMAAGTLYLFDWALVRFDQDLTAARTVALTAMVVFQTFHLGNSRSDHESIFRRDPFSNRFLFVAAFGALAVHLAALHLGPTQFVLRVQPIMDLGAWVRIVLVSLTIVAAIELHKLVRRPRWVTGAPPVDVRPPDRRSPRPAQAS